MIDQLADVVTVIAVLIETSAVFAFFAGLGALVLMSFGFIPGPY